MTLVDIDISIGGDAHLYRHQWVNHIKLNIQHFLVTHILIIDTQAVVATHPYLTLSVRDVELVMGIADCRVQGVLIVIDGIVVESFQPVTLKDICRFRPVSLATGDMTDIAVGIM